MTALVVSLNAWFLGPPLKDSLLFSGFLLLSGGVTLSIGHVMTRYGLGRLGRSVRGKLVLVLLLSAALALINIAFTAYLMFFSSHDLALLSLLLVFSLGMAIFFALAISDSFHDTMREVLRVVRQMGAGQLNARMRVRSRDEMEELAAAFNSMAEKLEATFAKQQELEQARRYLVAAVSHDLRTPLASMRAMVESINDGGVTDPETTRRYLRTLQTEVEYLSRLIDDLFEMAQIDSGLISMHIERASLQDLISDTIETLSSEAKKRRLTLQGSVDEALPPVLMDAKRIQRVLYNLLQNAMRHTPADGTIYIRAEATGDEVRVAVADTGEGIPAEELPKLFERFHRGDKARSRTGGGSGLGLSIAKGIVEGHGGRIWAESAPGRGAVFTFTLPRRLATDAPTQAGVAAS